MIHAGNKFCFDVCRSVTLLFVSIYTGEVYCLMFATPPILKKHLLGSGRITEMTKMSSRTAEIRVSAEQSHACIHGDNENYKVLKITQTVE